MKVIQYTQLSHETVKEEITVMTPVTHVIERVKEVEVNTYEVELTQEQIDIIVAICGNVIGGGSTRKLTDGIWSGLQDYTTKEDGYRKYSFKDFFTVKESTQGFCGYIITKDDSND